MKQLQEKTGESIAELRREIHENLWKTLVGVGILLGVFTYLTR